MYLLSLGLVPRHKAAHALQLLRCAAELGLSLRDAHVPAIQQRHRGVLHIVQHGRQAPITQHVEAATPIQATCQVIPCMMPHASARHPHISRTGNRQVSLHDL